MDIAPNQTLFVSNLQINIRKHELKKILYALFGQFGKIVDVVAMRSDKLRGQAWIVFADIAAATTALRSMQDFPFFDRPLVRPMLPLLFRLHCVLFHQTGLLPVSLAGSLAARRGCPDCSATAALTLRFATLCIAAR
jgi:hypothetical protein